MTTNIAQLNVPGNFVSEALIYRINVAESKLGVSRSTIYRMVKDHQLELVKLGKRSSGITAKSIHDMIERNKSSAETIVSSAQQMPAI